MPFPPAVDQAIRKRFADLIDEGKRLYAAMHGEAEAERQAASRQRVSLIGEYAQLPTEYQSFRTKALNLVEHVGASARFADEIQKGVGLTSDAAKIVGILHGLADDYANGFLDPIFRRAEAEITADYLGQAEGLLMEGASGKYDHVPAAVLLGAVLEQALRTLCGRQTPRVPVVDVHGGKRTMNPLVDDLKKAGAFNEESRKSLRLPRAEPRARVT